MEHAFGGIAGYKYKYQYRLPNEESVLRASYNQGKIKGNNIVGGIAGQNDEIIENCYNGGMIEKQNDSSIYIGGIIGTNTGKLSNSYNRGKLNFITNNNMGGVSGKVEGASEISNCFYKEETAIGGVAGVDTQGAKVHSEEFMKTKYFVSELGKDNWKIISEFPVLYWQKGDELNDAEFTTVSTAIALKDLAYIVNDIGEKFEGKEIALSQDINLSGLCSASMGNWIPIGNSTDRYFAGTFNGNGHFISNLYINNISDEKYKALFGVVRGGNIKDIKIKESKISSNSDYTAFVVASLDGGSINNCHAISDNPLGDTYSVSGTNYVGGIAAEVKNSASVVQCSNTCKVVGNTRIGGIAGSMLNSSASIRYSYNSGKIGLDSGTSEYVGGIVAESIGKVYACYNTANLVGNNYVGGIVGISDENTLIQSSYNIGNITSAGYAGGIVASAIENENYAKNYYLEGTASYGMIVMPEAIGKDISRKAEVHSAEYMKSKYIVDEIGVGDWKIVENKNDGYPILIWQEGERKNVDFSTIASVLQLNELKHIVKNLNESLESKTITLTSNITIQSDDWTPIGIFLEQNNFAGTLEGLNHVITIEKSDSTVLYCDEETEFKELYYYNAQGYKVNRNGYILSGLVLYYDGLDNAGYGNHSTNATVWKDLSGRGNDGNLTGGSWDEKFLALDGSSFVSCKNNNPLYNGEGGHPNMTVEVVSKKTSSTNGNLLAFSHRVAVNAYMDLWTTEENNKAYEIIYGSTSKQIPYTQIPLNTINTVSYGKSDTLYYTYLDGSNIHTMDVDNTKGWFADNVLYIGRQIENDQWFIGDVYSIRIYNKDLTSQEISINANIDNERFEN